MHFIALEEKKLNSFRDLRLFFVFLPYLLTRSANIMQKQHKISQDGHGRKCKNKM